MDYILETAKSLNRHIVEYIDGRYSEDYKEHCKKIFESETLASMGEGKPHFREVNEFASELMIEVSKKVYAAHRERVVEQISKEILILINDLFSEDEAKQFYDFVHTDAGSKLLRNLDLIRDACAPGLNILAAETVKAWSQPEVAEAIENFIREIEGDVDADDDSSEWDEM